MHGLLAVSALHYAYVHPEERREYILASARYQDCMLPYFATRLNDINDDNCEAYFFLASLIFILSAFRIAHHDMLDKSVTPYEVAQSFGLLQGVKKIMDYRPIENWKYSGPLSQLLRSPIIYAERNSGSGFLARLDKVTTLARQLPITWDVINEQTACILAIESLRATYEVRRVSEGMPGSVWRWPIYLPDRFVAMLNQGEPTTLVILAHFASLVRLYENYNWASRGWSKAVISMVDGILDDEMKQWIEWPKKSILQEIDIDEMEV